SAVQHTGTTEHITPRLTLRGQFVKHHYLGNKSADGSDVRKTAGRTEFAKIFSCVTLIIRFVIILRKQVQETFIIRAIATLERVNEDQSSCWFKHPGTLAKYLAPYLWREFVKQENAGHGILAVVGQGNCFRLADYKTRP